ncbi:NACHT domain-containing protein [Streptomyces bikiniensis]|uniref:NACHT domain-containing protein n=1 Tax=Streptomyces bikiniensis TaxID=1896 RepID=A0ABW8CKT0_STRBI
MIAETAALRLGTTVANAAGQLWLGGKRKKQESLLSMDELVRVRVPGLRLQREVRQQFEQIANAIFDRLEPFLQNEFQRLEEGGRQAVIDAVADTFGRADLSDEALFAANARPAELIRHITGSVREPVGLNEIETRLFEILFAECVEYYVRIVRNLPVFEERAAGELLTRTATLGVEVARILERLPDRSLFAPDGTDHDASFRRRYLELISRDLDEVELIRRTSDQTSAPCVRLSVAYVSLRATGGEEGRRAKSRYVPPLRLDMSNWEEGDSDTSGMRVEAALGAARRILLRGEAGSGKTTLLRWLAITAARGAFTGPLADWNGLTPIFVKLREYSGRTPPKPEAMLDAVAGSITGVMPRGWVERQLNSGNALLLIDGLDELLDRERRVVRDWLRKLLGEYGSVRVVVTSRPAAAGPDWLKREKFTALQLGRMTPPDLAAFVRKWHQAVRDLGEGLPCSVDDLPQYEQSLLASLKDRAHLQSLAGTPLLAAMLCAMHLDRGRQLPRDRMTLYRNALHTLVHDRDAERNVPSALESELSLGDKLVILRDLAWRFSDNNQSEVDLGRAEAYVTAKLKAMRHLEIMEGDRVLEQLRHRSGILRSPAEGRVDFLHRTFQEYLAAEEAAEEDRIGNLVGRAHLDMWRETIIMAAGHANTRQREELLHGILDRAECEPRYARTLRLLAAACQETLPSMSEGLAKRLDEAVAKLLPARRETDPPALAAVGHSLLRWLPKSLGGLTEKAAIQTVRTVALIGGDDSLKLLSGYVGDGRREVVRELINAWDYFDAEMYVREVLIRLPLSENVVSLRHSGQTHSASCLPWMTQIKVYHAVRDLEFLAGFPALNSVWINNLEGDADLSVLGSHRGIEYCMLFGEGSTSGGAIFADLPELRWLAMPRPGQVELDSLSLLPKLEVASLYHVAAEVDLSPLTKLPNLRDVHLVVGDGQSLAPGFTHLGRMDSLECLWIYGCDLVGWLEALKDPPPSLARLYLHNCVLPVDRSAFKRFKGLSEVSLHNCRTRDGGRVVELDLPGVRIRGA